MKKIDIILPNRIGDAILSLPLMVCLDQLNKKYQNKQKITILPPTLLFEIFTTLNIFKTKKLNYFTKIQSWFNPADTTFFMMTTSQNLGYSGKKKYGEIFPHKKLIKYDVDAKYLDFDYSKENLPMELQQFLKEECNLSCCSIRYFGFCYDLGYTTEQIISTFKFNKNSLNIQSKLSNFKTENFKNDYVVFCMEAAYGRRTDSDRRWGAENYFDIAEEVNNKHGLNSVFIGIDNSIPVPAKPYFTDLRKKISMADIAKIMINSKGYIGNDTGPLHLANLLKKKSIGIYLRETTAINYSPIFKDLNKAIICPNSPDDILPYLDELLCQS